MNLYGNQEDVKAFAGSLYGMNPKSVISYPAKAEVAFGKGVFIDGNGKVSNTKSGGKFVGVALFHQCEGGKYFEKDSVACIEDGCVWVVIGSIASVDIGATAYVANNGEFTAESSDAEEVGKFKSAPTNGLALVELSK